MKIFFKQNSNIQEAKAEEGLSFLEIAHNNEIDLQGSCGGFGTCGTCHIIINEEWMNKLQMPTDEELSVLDIVFGVEKNSRLACQVIFEKEMDGIEVEIPQ